VARAVEAPSARPGSVSSTRQCAGRSGARPARSPWRCRARMRVAGPATQRYEPHLRMACSPFPSASADRLDYVGRVVSLPVSRGTRPSSVSPPRSKGPRAGQAGQLLGGRAHPSVTTAPGRPRARRAASRFLLAVRPGPCGTTTGRLPGRGDLGDGVSGPPLSDHHTSEWQSSGPGVLPPHDPVAPARVRFPLPNLGVAAAGPSRKLTARSPSDSAASLQARAPSGPGRPAPAIRPCSRPKREKRRRQPGSGAVTGSSPQKVRGQEGGPRPDKPLRRGCGQERCAGVIRRLAPGSHPQRQPAQPISLASAATSTETSDGQWTEGSAWWIHPAIRGHPVPQARVAKAAAQLQLPAFAVGSIAVSAAWSSRRGSVEPVARAQFPPAGPSGRQSGKRGH